MPTLAIPGYTLRPLGGNRLTRGFIRPVDTELYVIETPDHDTKGQVELVNFHDGEPWGVWYAPAWIPNELRQAIAKARNEPRRYSITVKGNGQ